ncbi:hypothetical protein K469DRAFT_726446 [Zopfia rhizophila CBS 207.26]|uniref:Uncharacterized protein n=1 Tax=Zopfia rhizophila CBS 207.26 TaxID=1314779 RepID=A0A6A6E756_9PEZI|nr:hypothetical protein K469DRAFT_726446 [Zopfia rhizophila CBS 207.26]
MPQIILSIIYYSYNSLFTSLLVGHEWNSYASSRKGLRPYRFALPLMALSGILHWLCSQSLFLVSLNVQTTMQYKDNYFPRVLTDGQINGTEAIYDFEPEPVGYVTCAYSPQAILATIIMSLLMVAALVWAGLRKFKNGIPVAGTCSAAISATCYVPEGEVGEKSAFLPVQWGVTGSGDGVENGVGHCAFSSMPVERPVEGALYAGALEMGARVRLKE